MFSETVDRGQDKDIFAQRCADGDAAVFLRETGGITHGATPVELSCSLQRLAAGETILTGESFINVYWPGSFTLKHTLTQRQRLYESFQSDQSALPPAMPGYAIIYAILQRGHSNISGLLAVARIWMRIRSDMGTIGESIRIAEAGLKSDHHGSISRAGRFDPVPRCLRLRVRRFR
jgi:hypothetical protein